MFNDILGLGLGLGAPGRGEDYVIKLAKYRRLLPRFEVAVRHRSLHDTDPDTAPSQLHSFTYQKKRPRHAPKSPCQLLAFTRRSWLLSAHFVCVPFCFSNTLMQRQRTVKRMGLELLRGGVLLVNVKTGDLGERLRQTRTRWLESTFSYMRWSWVSYSCAISSLVYGAELIIGGADWLQGPYVYCTPRSCASCHLY